MAPCGASARTNIWKALGPVLMAVILPATALGFDWSNDAPRLDYQGGLQLQRDFTRIGSSLILTWRGLGLELEHEEGDPFREVAAALFSGTVMESDLYRLKAVYRWPLGRQLNCRLSAGYGCGDSRVSFETGILPLVIAAGLGFYWDGKGYSYSERTNTWTAKAALEKDFWEIFKAELLAGISHYNYSDDLKMLYSVHNWSPSIGLALGIHTPFGR